MHSYGLSNSLCGGHPRRRCVAIPFRDLILQIYVDADTVELDDAARVDVASAVQGYLRIYLPLMTGHPPPALAVSRESTNALLARLE